jgi:cephalosporin hydroxylase
MLTFEEAYLFTSRFSSSAAFEEPEARLYFHILSSLPPGSRVIEVGLQWGRSSSIALQVTREHGLSYAGVDPFNEADGQEAFDAWAKMADESGALYAIHRIISDAFTVTPPIDAILIDGDHEEDQVYRDCDHFLPHVSVGGYAMFHDYGRESLPGVWAAVNRYMLAHQEWEYICTEGTLGVWRKR